MKNIFALAVFALAFAGCTLPPPTAPEPQPQIQREPPAPQSAPPPQPAARPKPKTYDGPPWYKYDLNEIELEVTTAVVQRKLKDASASIRDMKRHSRGMKDDYICGKLNIVNAEEGSPGLKRFYLTNKNAIIFEDDPIVGYLVRRMCSNPDAPATANRK